MSSVFLQAAPSEENLGNPMRNAAYQELFIGSTYTIVLQFDLIRKKDVC
jgi:hypothetical protein